MTRLTKVERIIAEKTVCILLVRGQGTDDQPIFAYVAVRADKLEAFIESQKAGTFYPEDFGVIVESGAGEPPPEVRERMAREYGFNHEGMVDIPDLAKAGSLTRNLGKIIPRAE